MFDLNAVYRWGKSQFRKKRTQINPLKSTIVWLLTFFSPIHLMSGRFFSFLSSVFSLWTARGWWLWVRDRVKAIWFFHDFRVQIMDSLYRYTLDACILMWTFSNRIQFESEYLFDIFVRSCGVWVHVCVCAQSIHRIIRYHWSECTVHTGKYSQSATRNNQLQTRWTILQRHLLVLLKFESEEEEEESHNDFNQRPYIRTWSNRS